MKWYVKEQLPDGSEWVSAWRESRDIVAVRQEIIGGHVSGLYRAAIDYDTGAIIFGLDKNGNELPVITK